MKDDVIELDGSQGEGGGQVLRSALTLSMITGRPFRIVNIRANRAKPGLMRQHLVSVQAAAAVCGADVAQAAVGARELAFRPGRIRGGTYNFAIGTAGSSTLVLQTLLPALLFGDAPSTVTVSGGTHNPKAPPAHFLQRSYGRVMAGMGAEMSIELKRHGFYPAGGGEIVARVQPCAQLRRIELMAPGERRDAYAESLVAAVPSRVARRELECVAAGLGWAESQLHERRLPDDEAPGNALLITLDAEHVTEVFAGFGEKAVRAEEVAKQALGEARRYLASGAAVGEHLADQLLLPMALAGGGRFTLDRVSQHALTNADVIGRFLPVDIRFEAGERHSTCTISAR
ncbi:RNA 3'-phosphate cyclase [Massilia sp. Root418]|jgi:RNA 3'-terminal phosphate cyclase (ATP)|nr:RNA 3'-phosphate cyclase [Massilia sp. Root418]